MSTRGRLLREGVDGTATAVRCPMMGDPCKPRSEQRADKETASLERGELQAFANRTAQLV
jgi:hypothetical protein